jgi:hypothetical protein
MLKQKKFMANYYHIKARGGSYFDEQTELVLNFIDQQGYTNICFLHDTLKKMEEHTIIGKALIKKWGTKTFNQFVKTRAIEIDGKHFSFGTVKTLSYNLDDFDVVVHFYAYSDSFLNALEYTHAPDHIFVYWLDEQPELDTWMGILNAQNINPQQHIPAVNWNHLPAAAIAELSRINEVNVGDGGTHSMDERLIKEVVQKINKKGAVLDAATFKAFLIREIGFKAPDAEKSAYKVRNYLK